MSNPIRDDSDCEHITMDWLDVPKDKSPEVHIEITDWTRRDALEWQIERGRKMKRKTSHLLEELRNMK